MIEVFVRCEQNGMSMAEEWIHLAKRPSEHRDRSGGGDEGSAFIFVMTRTYSISKDNVCQLRFVNGVSPRVSHIRFLFVT